MPLEQEVVGPEQDAPAEKTARGFATVRLPVIYENRPFAAVLEVQNGESGDDGGGEVGWGGVGGVADQPQRAASQDIEEDGHEEVDRDYCRRDDGSSLFLVRQECKGCGRNK